MMFIRKLLKPSIRFKLFKIGSAAYITYTQLLCIEDAIIQKARSQINKEINSMQKEYGKQMATYPEVVIGMRQDRYFMEFLVDQRKCDVFTLLVSALNILQKEENIVRVVRVKPMNSDAIYNLTIDFEECIGNPKSKNISYGTIYLSGEMINERPAFKLTLEKTVEFTKRDLDAFMASYRDANKPRLINFSKNHQVVQKQEKISSPEAQQKLEELGVTVFMPEGKAVNLDWDYLAGYERQKRDIEDTVLLALQHPDIYDAITTQTRVKNEPNRPKAVLFEGPPGTGKTTSAKIIAQQVKIPLVYLPIESIVSKWYGESEKRFSDIWENCQKLGRVIIFIDEIDAIAQSRNSDMHEASRRILSTLLRKIDSFESSTDVLLICATNRKEDLDAAMLSRLDLSVKFELPDKLSREAIFYRYAKHLTDDERKKLSEVSQGMSGRNISDICKDAERRWAAKIIRKEVDSNVPSLEQYLETLKNRQLNFL